MLLENLNSNALGGLLLSSCWTLGLSMLTPITRLVIYRLTLHPLAKYPGPFFAEVTRLYSTYHAWKGDRHLDFHRCHEIYGPVFRYVRHKLSFNTSTALHTIYGFKSNIRKSDSYINFQSPAGPSVFTSIPKELHARKRRGLAHAFSGELFFGKTFGMLEKSDNRWVLGMTIDAGKLAFIRTTNTVLVKAGLEAYLFPDLFASKLKFAKFAHGQAEEGHNANVERKDFYHYMLEAEDPGTGSKYSQQELWGEANVLISNRWDRYISHRSPHRLYYLNANPSVLQKVRKEIEESFPSGDVEDIKSGGDLNSCQYLRACLDEAMRMTPPVPGILPRTVLPGGQMIDDHNVPTGTEVSVPSYAIHITPHTTPEPLKYRPERWIAAKVGKEKAEQAYSAFAAFSLGPRDCIGKNMAYLEMVITMARVLTGFEMKVVDVVSEGTGEHRGEFQVKNQLNTWKNGTMVDFFPVKT